MINVRLGNIQFYYINIIIHPMNSFLLSYGCRCSIFFFLLIAKQKEKENPAEKKKENTQPNETSQ